MGKIRLTPSFIKMVAGKRRKRIPARMLVKEYHASEHTISDATKLAVKNGDLTEEEYYKITHGNKKLYPEVVKSMLRDRLGPSGDGSDGMTIKKMAKKYEISRRTISYATNKKAVDLGLITEERVKELKKEGHRRGHEAMLKKYGEKRATDLRMKGFYKMLAKEPDFFKRIGSLGGKSLQKQRPDIAKKLSKYNSPVYGHGPGRYYKRIRFRSRGERLTGALLLEYGLIDKISDGVNFQVPINEKSKIRVDFLVKGRAIEFHNPTSIDSYKEEYGKKRKQELLREGFKGEVIVIPKESEIYDGLKQIGIKDNNVQYLERKKEVLEKIKNYEEEHADKIKVWEQLEKEKNNTRGVSVASQKLKQRPSLEMLAFAYR